MILWIINIWSLHEQYRYMYLHYEDVWIALNAIFFWNCNLHRIWKQIFFLISWLWKSCFIFYTSVVIRWILLVLTSFRTHDIEFFLHKFIFLTSKVVWFCYENVELFKDSIFTFVWCIQFWLGVFNIVPYPLFLSGVKQVCNQLIVKLINFIWN